MSVWNLRLGRLWVSVHHDRVSGPEWKQYLDDLSKVLETAQSGGEMTVLTIAYQVENPNASQRKALADLIVGSGVPRVGRHAFFSDSVITRGVLTALDWLFKKPYEERVFGDPVEAIRWAAETVHQDPEEVLAEIARVVPERALPSTLIEAARAVSKAS